MLCISFLRSSGTQAELQLRLALTAPLERRKGNTQHLLVSTCELTCMIFDDLADEGRRGYRTKLGVQCAVLSSLNSIYPWSHSLDYYSWKLKFIS